jgi:hypothetical protein
MMTAMITAIMAMEMPRLTRLWRKLWQRARESARGAW